MKTLVIAPHPDDEIIGVGGLISKRVSQGNEVYVCIVCSGSEPLYHKDLVLKSKKECLEADSLLGVKETIFLDFPSVMLEQVPRYQFNDAFLKLIQRILPDEVFIPHRGDMQLDHKYVVDAVMVALRPKYEHRIKRILSYETLSETGWDIPNTVNEFIPNVYVDITDYLDNKIQAFEKYQSQICKFPNPRSGEAIRALALFRGSTVHVCAAESFSLVREFI